MMQPEIVRGWARVRRRQSRAEVAGRAGCWHEAPLPASYPRYASDLTGLAGAVPTMAYRSTVSESQLLC